MKGQSKTIHGLSRSAVVHVRQCNMHMNLAPRCIDKAFNICTESKAEIHGKP